MKKKTYKEGAQGRGNQESKQFITIISLFAVKKSTMKLLHSLCFLSVASAAALSVPVADIPSDTNLVPGELVGYGADEVEIRTPNEANVLEARASPTCRRIGRVISRYGTSSAV